MDRRDARVVTTRTRIALTIAGSDSGGGAGVQADLKTFAALGVYGASAITALTAQNTRAVTGILAAPPDFVRAQIDAVLDDFDVAAIKIGMLASARIAIAVAEALRRPLLPLQEKSLPPGEDPGVSRGSATDEGSRRKALVWNKTPGGDPSSVVASQRHLPPQGGKGIAPFLIYDPVMVASSGEALAEAGFVAAIKARLLPLIDCLTPNLAEAAALLDAPLAAGEAEMAAQGAALLAFGPRAVLMKGGHLAGDEAVDLLVTAGAVRRFAAPRLASPNLHGTGCTLSSAIAAHIVLGADLPGAVAAAKDFVREAIERGRGVTLGGGSGPLAPLALAGRPVDRA
jgi:hydroxymethylpyrimidine/phosphomethylpyrimidine kinase